MALWKIEGGWKYEYFEPDIDPALFPQFESLLSLWQSKRNGRRVPSKQDFDFYDFKGWHGWIALYDVAYDPFNYVTRLSGTNIDDLYGFSATGLTSDEMNQVYAETANRDEFDELSCRNLWVSYTTGPLNIEGRTYNRVAYLELPLSDNGERATSTIEAVLPYRDDKA